MDHLFLALEGVGGDRESVVTVVTVVTESTESVMRLVRRSQGTGRVGT